MDNIRGFVYIIPSDDIMKSEFSYNIDSSHLDGFQRFSDENNLGYEFEPGDYQEAPCQLALDGHLVVKTVEDSGLCIYYLPKVVTDRQSLWFNDHRFDMMKYSMIGAYLLYDSMNDIRTVEGSDKVMFMINKRNMNYVPKSFGHK